MNKDLDLYDAKNGISLKSFLKEYDATSLLEYNLLFVAYLKDEKGCESVGVNEIYTCYKALSGVKESKDLKQSIYNTSHKGWLNTKSIEDINVSEAGRGVLANEIKKTNNTD